MTTISPAPYSCCPRCGFPGEGTDRAADDGIHNANYICPAGHIWMTKWADLEDCY